MIFYFEADIENNNGKVYGTVKADYKEEAETKIKIHYVNGENIPIKNLVIKEANDRNFNMIYLGN
jgi:hypothetical protein